MIIKSMIKLNLKKGIYFGRHNLPKWPLVGSFEVFEMPLKDSDEKRT